MNGYRPILFCLLTTALLCLGQEAAADSWASAQIKEVFSPSRDHFVRVIPGESLGDTVGFAGEKKGKFASAEFYRRGQDLGYRLVARATLANPIAPVDFFVSDGGRLATLDNWHNLGYGKVVSLYDSNGQLVRSYDLRDLFQSDEISAFPHSVSSIQWRSGPAYIRQDQKTLLVTVKSGGDFLFGLESGQYKYCEYHEKTYRCRSANQPRRWLANDHAPLLR